MKEQATPAARGFAQEIPGGWVFGIGNEWLTRRIHCINGRIGTTSLVHNLNVEEYLEETVEEFSIEVSRSSERRNLDFAEFIYVGHDTPHWDDGRRQLVIRLEAELEGSKVAIKVSYEALSSSNHIDKWIEVLPSDSDWTVEWVTIEHLRLREMVEGVTPINRYPNRFENDEDDVHSDPRKVSTENPKNRFTFGDRARSVVTYWGFDEGLFFFTSDPLGSESFDRTTGMLLRQKAYASLSRGLTTGRATIGAYAGSPEIGFKRFIEHIDRCCVIDEKSTPVEWNTWFVTHRNNAPLLTNYDRNLLIEQIDLMRDAGLYDVLHLDLGWEAGKPMQPDPDKFPNGLDEIVRRAKDCGIDMAYWINPFSSNYWKSDVEEEHPEWLNPGKLSGQSGAHAICHLTDHFDYVKERMIELVTRHNARILYWDGGDWNIPYCTGTGHGHSSQHELEARATERLVELARSVREARPDAIISVFSLPFDNHRAAIVDQQQISDTYAFPTVKSELIQRQQMYQMTWEHPYRAIRSSWHGVNWHEASGEDLDRRPLRELIHAEMSMIGSGVPQAGASIDLKQAPKEFVEFLRKMLAWRKRFERYFTVYQHILGFPDGESVDGEGHIIDEKGFLVLINPTEEAQTINLPLEEPQLELSDGKRYDITDWSDFEQARPLGSAILGDDFEVDLAPLEVRIFGIDIQE